MANKYNKTCAVLIFALSLTGCMIFTKEGISKDEIPRRSGLFVPSLPSYHYSLGVLHQLEGDLDSAIREFREALRLDPRSSFLVAELAGVYLAKGEKEEARDLCLEYLQSHPGDTLLRLTLGGIFRQLKNYREAMGEYLHVIQREPNNITALFYLGLTYGESGNLRAARETYEKIVSLQPDHVMASYYLARIHLSMKNQREAEEWLKITISLVPSFEPALLELALLYERQQRNALAIDIYRKYLDVYPESPKLSLRLAEAYVREKRFDEAENELKKAAALDDKDRELLYMTGLFYYERARYLESYGIFQDYLRDYPDDHKARYLFAAAAQELRRYPEALEAYEKIAVDADMFVSARLQMGFILEKSGQLERAILLLGGTILQKKSPSLYSLLASLYEKKKESTVAEKILREGIAEFPREIDLYYSLGVLYEKTERLEPALEQMRIILLLDPDNAEALNFIGYSWADRGINLAEAEGLIRKALALKPRGAHIIDSLGWVLFRQGKNDLAIKYLTEAWKELPDDPTVAEHLGDALYRDGRLTEALELYRQAVKLNPGNKGLEQKIADISKRL